MTDLMDSIKKAAERISRADGLLMAAGAGMGVDSGLPDFRGDKGFWRAYPPLKELGISFVDMANPRWFAERPEMAWAFYGHRFNLYADTPPHEGFSLLRKWSEGKSLGKFVFTSNVDGHFQKGGFGEDDVYECHGSINHLQCLDGCTRDIWANQGLEFDVELKNLSIDGEVPKCPACGAVARPNILMFNDWSWLPERTEAQGARLEAWLESAGGGGVAGGAGAGGAGTGNGKFVIIECGAGTAVPTVRTSMEAISRRYDAPLIRINPRESHGPASTISIEMHALEALGLIDRELKGRS